MKLSKIIWLILILLLLISSPGVINRWSAEAQNNTYEIVAPYEEIYELSLDGAFSIQSALQSLKDSGLTTVSVSPLSLSDLEDYRILSIYDEQELANVLRFSTFYEEFNTEVAGYYLTIPTNPIYKELITDFLHPQTVSVGDSEFYFIPKENGINRSTVVGYDPLAIEQIKSVGLNYILRTENEENMEEKQKIIAQLIAQKSATQTGLLFSGSEVIGYPTNNLKNWTKQLHEQGYYFYFIEFDSQKGIDAVAELSDYHIVRLHSIDLNDKSVNDLVSQAIRAIKERNFRSIMFHFQSTDPEMSLSNANSFISGVHQKLPAQFTSGTPIPFEEINIPSWITISVLLAGVLFTALTSMIFRNKWVSILMGIGMLMIAVMYLLFEKIALLQGFTLIIACLTPLFALFSSIKGEHNITLQFAKAIAINFIGVLIIVGLLNGNEFISGFEVFRGVKLVYLIPILLTGILLFYRQILGFLQTEVKYWHLLLFLMVGVIGVYYMARTGNNGSVSSMELLLRDKLEELLYVRPRTKEFLIGFPLFLLGLYTIRKHEILGKFFLLGGVIGLLSMVNTFTHLHIPLAISLLRTAYSIILGYFIGMFLIYLFKRLFPSLINVMKKRWI